MLALLSYLETYRPADADLSWSDVWTAPETPERKLMGWHSMRSSMRRLLNVLCDGEVTLPVSGQAETFTRVGLRVHRAAFGGYIGAAGNKRNAGGLGCEGYV